MYLVEFEIVNQGMPEVLFIFICIFISSNIKLHLSMNKAGKG